MTDVSGRRASRRDVLRTVGAVGIASIVGLTSTAVAEQKQGRTYGNGNGIGAFLNEKSEIVDHPVFTGQIADMRDMETVEVEVGNNIPVTPFEVDFGGQVVTIEEVPFGFDPRVVRVSTGTQVDFVWSDDVLLPVGFPIPHNVVAVPDKDGTVAFNSGGVVFAPNSFSVPFDEPGTYLYYCTPHGGLEPGQNFAAMRGAILVSPS